MKKTLSFFAYEACFAEAGVEVAIVETLTREELEDRLEKAEARNRELQNQVNWLKEQFKLAKHRQFGPSSEKMSALFQTELLFNEAEATLDSTPAESEPETITYTRKPKSTGQREEMLADLPTEVIEYKLAEDEQTCSQCGGHLHEKHLTCGCIGVVDMAPKQSGQVRRLSVTTTKKAGVGNIQCDFCPISRGSCTPAPEYFGADDWHAYDDLKKVTLIGCWAHVRRKFVEALAVVPEKHRNDPTLLANIALARIERLYRIEGIFHDVTPARRLAARQRLSKPIVDGFKAWMDKESPLTLPQSLLGKAFTYCKNQWPKLIRFLDDGRLEIDNNRAERSIKPFVIGRKNWLFANTPRGAKTSALIYSIVETAKENGLNPFDYLKYLFERIKTIEPADISTVDSLLPWSEAVQAALRIQPSHTLANTSTA
jgi:hypothetical protein